MTYLADVLGRRGLLTAAMATLPTVVDAQTSAGLPFAQQTPMRCGAVSLRVRDLDRVGDYYRALLGLEVLDRTRESLALGTGGVALLGLLPVWWTPR